MRRGPVVLVLSVLLGALAASPGLAQHLFATDTMFPAPSLRRFTNSGGSVVSQPLVAGTLPEGVAFDDVAKQVYWVEASHSGARIRRTDPSLGPGTTLISGLGSLRGLAVDPVGGHMFWTASVQGSGALISRAELDGSNVQVLFNLLDFNPRQMALDRGNGWVYWTEFEIDGIARCRLDGADGQWVAFLPGGSRPYGIAVNEATQELYWTQYGTGTVEKMSLPFEPAFATASLERVAPLTLQERSTALATAARVARPQSAKASASVLNGLVNPTHLTLDVAAGYLFVSQAGVGVQSIRRAKLDGSGLVTLPVTQNAFGGLVAVGVALLDAPEPPGDRPAGVPLSLAARNPARDQAEMSFGLPASGRVRLRVLDAAGRVVATLAEGEHAAGPHRVMWTGETISGRAAPGMYVAYLEVAGKALTRRFAYLR